MISLQGHKVAKARNLFPLGGHSKFGNSVEAMALKSGYGFRVRVRSGEHIILGPLETIPTPFVVHSRLSFIFADCGPPIRKLFFQSLPVARHAVVQKLLPAKSPLDPH